MSLKVDNQRLLDLVRYQRGELLTEGLITQEEFAELVQVGSASARRLEDYDELRSSLSALKAQLAAERDERSKTVRKLTTQLASLCANCREALGPGCWVCRCQGAEAGSSWAHAELARVEKSLDVTQDALERVEGRLKDAILVLEGLSIVTRGPNAIAQFTVLHAGTPALAAWRRIGEGE